MFQEFPKWVRPGKEAEAGLVQSRAEEDALCGAEPVEADAPADAPIVARKRGRQPKAA